MKASPAGWPASVGRCSHNHLSCSSELRFFATNPARALDISPCCGGSRFSGFSAKQMNVLADLGSSQRFPLSVAELFVRSDTRCPVSQAGSSTMPSISAVAAPALALWWDMAFYLLLAQLASPFNPCWKMAENLHAMIRKAIL